MFIDEPSVCGTPAGVMLILLFANKRIRHITRWGAAVEPLLTTLRWRCTRSQGCTPTRRFNGASRSFRASAWGSTGGGFSTRARNARPSIERGRIVRPT